MVKFAIYFMRKSQKTTTAAPQWPGKKPAIHMKINKN